MQGKSLAGAAGLVTALITAHYFANVPAATAQSGSRFGGQVQDGSGTRGTGSGETRDRREPDSQSFEAKFWSWIRRVHYQNWAPAAGQTGDYYPGQSPHGAFLKLYLNRTAAANPRDLPHGSVIIKENFGEDKQTLMAVTIMYRAQGYDAANQDWYWVKYNPDGTVAAQDGARLAGQVQGCIDCHRGAEGNDFAFFND